MVSNLVGRRIREIFVEASFREPPTYTYSPGKRIEKAGEIVGAYTGQTGEEMVMISRDSDGGIFTVRVANIFLAPREK